jgi:nitrite reductase/ring-hydroxylating ferredoxin subunit
MALRLNGPVPRGMYISASRSFISCRPAKLDGRDVLIFGGEPHAPGQEPESAERLARLERRARALFDVEEVLHRWSTHDNVTMDRLPYVGRLHRAHPNVWVATGFAGWGMTNGTAAGMILADLIGGRFNAWARAYDPLRPQTGARVCGLIRDVVVGTRDLLGAWSTNGASDASAIPRGGSAIVRRGVDRVAVHRDERGALHAVSAVCTHEQCIVRWNDAERSWDCPCHGSRFDVDGEVLHGPAVRALEPVRLVEEPGARSGAENGYPKENHRSELESAVGKEHAER